MQYRYITNGVYVSVSLLWYVSVSMLWFLLVFHYRIRVVSQNKPMMVLLVLLSRVASRGRRSVSGSYSVPTGGQWKFSGYSGREQDSKMRGRMQESPDWSKRRRRAGPSSGSDFFNVLRADVVGTQLGIVVSDGFVVHIRKHCWIEFACAIGNGVAFDL